MAAPKGHKKYGGGRKKGTPNKVTAELKAMILGALSAKGGQKYLEQIADEQPVAFCALLGKVLPSELSGPNGGAIKHKVTLVVKRERSFFGHRSPGTAGTPDSHSGEPGEVQGGGVRTPLGQDRVGLNGSG